MEMLTSLGTYLALAKVVGGAAGGSNAGEVGDRVGTS